jgi:heat shock protein HtpX
MVLKRYKAQNVNATTHPKIYNMVEKLASRAQLPMPKVYVIEQKTPNAFATGRNPENAAVAVTTGITELLDEHELEGVIAHELSHIKNRDILTGTIAATLAGAVAMLAQMSRFGAHQRQRQNPIVLILLVVGAPLIAMMIRMAVSRVREFAADEGGANISRNPHGLAKALRKLHEGIQRHPLQGGNPAHAHMFILNPFMGGIQKLMASHPPTQERIQRLENMIITE